MDEIEAFLLKKMALETPGAIVQPPILIKCAHGYGWGGIAPGVVFFDFCRACPKVADCDSMKQIIREMQEALVNNKKI